MQEKLLQLQILNDVKNDSLSAQSVRLNNFSDAKCATLKLPFAFDLFSGSNPMGIICEFQTKTNVAVDPERSR